MSESHDHGARLTIDLGALQHNYRLLAARAAAAETAAVVKADAYGIGIAAAVPALIAAGCRTFYVAHLSEAAALRAVAPDVALYVLNGLPPGSASRYHDLKACPVLGCREELDEWREKGRGRPCAIHVDTGMNRLGFTPEAALTLDLSGLDVTTMLTHFVSSELPQDMFNALQYEAFEEMHRAFPSLAASMANSSAFFHDHAPFCQQYRAGYALYGGNPTPHLPNPMRPVVRLDAEIVQVRAVPKGETVGYNGRWTAPRDSVVAIVSTGYADGYPRNGANTDHKPGGSARVGGVTCPFAGNVSMDLIAVDVTFAPQELIGRGGTLALIDEVLTVDVVGQHAGTIGYEILTSLGRRYNRVYTGV
ncbi:MAG: alanine racemase [Proteobacteria bacterium]|nr:alanine racemase [Pseudomonadota bacterium]